MKKIYFIFFGFMFLTGCAQNLALLGPAFSVVKTGGVQHALVGETIKYGVKNKTGKKVSEHAMGLLSDEFEIIEIQECDDTYSTELQKIVFDKPEDADCRELQ